MRNCSFILIALFAAMASAADLSAQVTAKFQEQRRRLEEAAGPTATARGLTEHEILANRLRNPFASPGVRIQKVLPGSSFAVTVGGDFPAGTTILSELDGVTLSGAALSTTNYSARLTIPPAEAYGVATFYAQSASGVQPRSRSSTPYTASISRARMATR